jgi:pimeloyl-ACP methyl ester carboxylesterase
LPWINCLQFKSVNIEKVLEKTMVNNTYVLIHGSWLGKFCWAEVTPRLEVLGHNVLTIDLPAHGDDSTPPENTSLASYRDAVIGLMGDRTDVILVGHSMAGVVISEVAEAIPDRLQALVYLCAYLPRSGESVYQLSAEDKESLVGKYWRQEHPEQYSPAWVTEEGIVKVFGADCLPDDRDLLVKRHRPEPVPPLATPATLTAEGYGRVPRYYIKTSQDMAVSHQLQTLMLSRVSVRQRFELPSSHCPFFSMPDRLVTCLTNLEN